MVNGIVRAVCDAVSKKFDNVEIYNEIVKQGFEMPCFCINAQNVEDSVFRGERYKFSTEIKIRYYDDNLRENGAEIMERLWDCLEYITTDETGLIRGSDMKNELNKDYFEFSVVYEFFYVRKEEKELMGSVKLEMEV